MKRIRKLTQFCFICTSLLIVLLSCSADRSSEIFMHSTKNPDAKEVLELYDHPDIIMWDDLIYLADVDWVDELELTKGAPVGEVTNQTDNPKDFTNGTANKLPVGTTMYSVKGENGLLIIEVNQTEKRYLALVEG